MLAVIVMMPVMLAYAAVLLMFWLMCCAKYHTFAVILCFRVCLVIVLDHNHL